MSKKDQKSEILNLEKITYREFNKLSQDKFNSIPLFYAFSEKQKKKITMKSSEAKYFLILE